MPRKHGNASPVRKGQGDNATLRNLAFQLKALWAEGRKPRRIEAPKENS
jgi:hypothetical protein